MVKEGGGLLFVCGEMGKSILMVMGGKFGGKDVGMWDEFEVFYKFMLKIVFWGIFFWVCRR